MPRIGYRPNIVNFRDANLTNRRQSFDRSWGRQDGYRRQEGWNGHYRHLHGDWYHGAWRGYRWPAWFAAGAAFGWLGAFDQQIVYDNPYCVPPPANVLVARFIDYSRPIEVPVEVLVPEEARLESRFPLERQGDENPLPATVEAEERDDTNAKQEKAKQIFDRAREAFKDGDYPRAQELDEQAIELLPSDATLHEFRALTLFAQKNYRDAAATIYAVLAVGPGWDWETLSALYPSTGDYTRQLRALENYRRNNPENGGANFLLAYHYLTIGATDAAIEKLEQTVELQPKDALAARMLKALKEPVSAEDRPQPAR